MRSFGHYERTWNKDLFDITYDEFWMVLYNTISNFKSVQYAGDIISLYIKWAYYKGLREEDISFFNEVNIEFYRKLSQTFFYTKEQIDEIISNCKIVQHKLIVALMFEGVDDTC